MKGRLFVIVFALATIILLCLAYRRPPRDPDAVPSASGAAVVIQTANPYGFDVRLEVKCDWEWQRRQYRFYQVIVVPGKRQTLIRVPNDLRFCEIWPKVLW